MRLTARQTRRHPREMSLTRRRTLAIVLSLCLGVGASVVVLTSASADSGPAVATAPSATPTVAAEPIYDSTFIDPAPVSPALTDSTGGEIKTPLDEPPPPDPVYVPGEATLVEPDSTVGRRLNPDGSPNTRVCDMHDGNFMVIMAEVRGDGDPFPAQSETAKTWVRPC